jgi:hypothetical protein
VLLGGYIEVLVDFSALPKFQFQHLLFRSIANARDAAGVYRNSPHAFLDADEPRKDQGRQLLLSSSGHQLDAVDRMVRDAHQHLSQTGLGIEAVSLAEPIRLYVPLRVLRQHLIRRTDSYDLRPHLAESVRQRCCRSRCPPSSIARLYGASAHPRREKPGLEPGSSRPQPGH